MTEGRARLTPAARAQIRLAHAWWVANREASPRLFLRELREAFDLLAASPRIGTPYPSATVPHARRLALRRTRFHVYYEIGDDQDVIVLAVWSALRGHGPPSMGPTVA